MTYVLIVDDNEDNRYLLRVLLQGHGFAVGEARHGAEALETARQNPPDLTISDLLMPVMDGYTLLRHWKADSRLKGIPFVVYTATYTEPRDERLALSLGADAFMVKPAEPESLMACVREVLAKEERGEPPLSTDPQLEDSVLLSEYNEVLIRKLEKRAKQLEFTNRELTEEIAERRRTEKALRESEERYRNLFHSMADSLFVCDRETLSCLTVNDAAVGRYGYSREEFLTMTMKDICLPSDLPALIDVLAGSRPMGAKSAVCRQRKKGGTVIEVEVSAYGFDYSGRPAYLIVTRDVTDSRRAEAELRLRDRAMQAVSQGIIITDPVRADNPITYVGAGVERITGYRPEEMIGRNCRFLQGKDTDPEAVAQLREAIAAGQSCTVEILNYRKDGTPFWNSLSVNPVRDDEGNLLYFVGVQSDVTDRKKLEEQLRQSQKMDAVGRLAGGVAHDFNNLLTIISGYSELLLGLPGVGDDVRESVTAISDAGERAASLTRQLLGFSRQTMLQPRVLDLNEVIGRTGAMLRRLIGEDILFTTVLNQRLKAVKVDPGQLDQVLMNLAVNARDAMPRGGKLTLETANVTFSEEYAAAHLDCQAGDYVMLAMTDTGCGMTPDIMARIFEPFFTTKDIGKGTGLGLAMVFGIVQQSGGCIHVYSEPGHGTTFKIYLPAVAEEVTTTVEPALKPVQRGTETVLLVEDEEGVRALAMMSLQMHGYRVLTAVDGRDALRVAQSHPEPIDLVLTDVVMPNLSGPVLAQALKAMFPQVKVVFMSGYTDDAVVRHGLLDANVSFIQKPYTPLALARKIRQVLDEENEAAG